MDDENSSRRGARVQISEARALAAFASPARARILDALAADGPSTASRLATRVGMAVGSASHHLRMLAEAGLVEEASGLSSDRRQRHWRLAHQHTGWSRAQMEDPSARTAAFQAELAVLQRQMDRARAAIVATEDDDEAESAAFSSQHWLTLSPDELRELSEEIVAVLHRWQDRPLPDDGAERESCFVFARGFPARP